MAFFFFRTTKDPLKQQQKPFMVAIPTATLKEFTSPVPSSNEESCDETEAILHSQTVDNDAISHMADISNVDTGSKVTENVHADTNGDSDTRKPSDTSADAVDTEPNKANQADTITDVADTVTGEPDTINIAGKIDTVVKTRAVDDGENIRGSNNCDGADMKNVAGNREKSHSEREPNVNNSPNSELSEADTNDDVILANTSVTSRSDVHATDGKDIDGDSEQNNPPPPPDTIWTPSTRKRGRPGQRSGSRSATTRPDSESKTRITGKNSELSNKSRTSPRKE